MPKPEYEVTISNLPRNEHAVLPEEMAGDMQTIGFQPKVAGDFTVWVGNSNLGEAMLQGALETMWGQRLHHEPLTVTVFHTDARTHR
jgi:hypothetical protein